MDKAIEVPICESQLRVNVGRDGVWLDFFASDGKAASLNIAALADQRGPVVKAALNKWHNDMIVKADSAANGGATGESK